MKGAHNQPVETVAGIARRDQILFQADFVLLIKETLEEPFQKTQVFRIDARNQGKMMDQQADPLQKCQGLFLEQYPRNALQELIRKKNFLVTAGKRTIAKDGTRALLCHVLFSVHTG